MRYPMHSKEETLLWETTKQKPILIYKIPTAAERKWNAHSQQNTRIKLHKVAHTLHGLLVSSSRHYSFKSPILEKKTSLTAKRAFFSLTEHKGVNIALLSAGFCLGSYMRRQCIFKAPYAKQRCEIAWHRDWLMLTTALSKLKSSSMSKALITNKQDRMTLKSRIQSRKLSTCTHILSLCGFFVVVFCFEGKKNAFKAADAAIEGCKNDSLSCLVNPVLFHFRVSLNHPRFFVLNQATSSFMSIPFKYLQFATVSLM